MKRLCKPYYILLAVFFIVLLKDLVLTKFILDGYADEIKYPSPYGFVNDYANLLKEDDAEKIIDIAARIQEKTEAEIVIVTLETTAPLTIEEYAVKLFQKWGIGKKDKDNGVLLLIAIKDKTVRIETGYGLEGALPDAICNQIIYKEIIPKFRNNAYSSGIINGFLAITTYIANEYNIKLNELSQDLVNKKTDRETLFDYSKIYDLVIFILVFPFLFITVFINTFFRQKKYRQNWYWYNSGYGGGFGGGFGGGSFGGFGGGLSGGGGATGRW